MMFKILILTCLVCFYSNLFSQENYRFQCDFSIKTLNFDSTLQLTVGSVFCDAQANRTVYRIQFPNAEMWLQTDSFIFKILANKKNEKLKLPQDFEHNIFLLILNNQLNTFGLQSQGYELRNVRRDDSLTVLEWLPKNADKFDCPKILISRKNNQLFGLVFFSQKAEIYLKIFFNKYIFENGLAVPTEIFKIRIINNQESYEKTTLENIKINNFEDDNLYIFPDFDR